MVNEALETAASLASSGRRGAMVTLLTGPGAGSASLLGPDLEVLAGTEPSGEVVACAREMMRTGVPAVIESNGREWFVEPVVPAPRMIVLGAISVADALVPMAAAAGYAVTVIDTRDWLARADRYPAASEVRCGDPVDEMLDVGLDESTVVVSFLHEARLEDDVLEAALRGPARYVGSMGSGRSTEAKRSRLSARRLTEEDLARLMAPIGIDIGSRTPQEIAVSVLAQIVAAGRGVM